jgi:hypothetical protein
MAAFHHTYKEARQLAAQARSLFRDHGHDGYNDALTRGSCGACALEGYGESNESGSLEPNHSGWERAYVQASRPIPAKYRQAFEDERIAGTPYATELERDITTFGVIHRSF